MYKVSNKQPLILRYYKYESLDVYSKFLLTKSHGFILSGYYASETIRSIIQKVFDKFQKSSDDVFL